MYLHARVSQLMLILSVLQKGLLHMYTPLRTPEIKMYSIPRIPECSVSQAISSPELTTLLDPAQVLV